jgi:hypothetical protein
MLTCDWDHPGVDRYTGTTEAAIHAYAEIPRATQDELIAKFERREFDDFVTIDRDSIRSSGGDYDPVIRRMHFGATPDHLCDTVDRSNWSPEHVETAIVVYADGWYVAAPTVCGNWFILGAMIRQQARPEATPPAPPDTPVDLTPPPLTYETVPVFGTPDNFYTLDSGGFYSADTGGFYGGGGWLPAPCTACCVPPVTPVTPPVPEPSTWVILAAGLLMLRRATRA